MPGKAESCRGIAGVEKIMPRAARRASRKIVTGEE
jgi:hypothetical protein